MYEELTFNLTSGARHRFANLDGRPHIVVPMVMIKEGVWEGSRGKVFYPRKELQKSVVAWNHKPIVVTHPKKGGKYVSGSLPDIINSHRIGLVLNTRCPNNKLGAEAWLDIQKTNEVDDRIIPAIIRREPVEVSTGLGIKRVQKRGVFKGDAYKYIGYSHQPDHLAVLPDEIGACSVKDGAGLLQLNRALRQVRNTDRKLYRATLDALDESGIKVSRKNGKLKIGFDSTPEDKDMAKFNRALAIKKLITNGLFTRDDREELEETPAGVLKSLLANEDFSSTKTKKKKKRSEVIVNSDDDEDDDDEPILKNRLRSKDEDDDDDDDEEVQNSKTKAYKEWKKNAPPEVLATLNRAARLEKRRKAKLIQIITANEANVLKKSYLKTLEPDLLEGIAVLAANTGEESEDDDGDTSDIFVEGFAPNYGGAGFGNTVKNSRRRRDEDDDDDESPLPVPTLNFSKKKRKHRDEDDDDDDEE